MSEETTPLHLPGHFPYPITITKLSLGPGAEVQRGTRLLEYSFTSATNRKLADEARRKGEKVTVKENDMVGSWECSVEGTLERWAKHVEVGRSIDAKGAREAVVFVQQPCTHPVQLHGMCGVCGKELAETDYLARPTEPSEAGPSRFPGSYEMGHDSLGVTVSHAEAERLDDQGRTRLLAARKLSLIVDLDQTIIHTTVDPTVGEWIEEINAEHRSGVETRNPNEEALKDVASFQLEDDLPPGWAKNVKAPDRTYYTKPRPGLPKFMEEMSRIYEMHVYTMGTRNYAEAIVKAVDPDGKYFGGRIVSRDENGSLNAKNLQRLFPTDQSMVIIIDDRSDVWSDVPNLVKVIPYEFFLGAGDINSSFLPPVKDGSTPQAEPLPTTSDSVTSASALEEASEEDSLARKAKMLDKLSEERPLQKMQEDMDKEAEQEVMDFTSGEGNGDGDAVAEIAGTKANGAQAEPSAGATTAGIADPGIGETGNATEAKEPETTTPPSSPPPRRRPLLKAEDGELHRIASILRRVHRKYYASYDTWDRQEDEDIPDDCDAPYLITEMKSQVLEGCSVVFSGLIPLHQRPETSYHWKLAESFGALPSTAINRQTTHCIAATPGTSKVYQAIQNGLHVVYPKWLEKSAALWKRQKESEYAMDGALGVSGARTGSKSASGTPAPPLAAAPSDVAATGSADDEEIPAPAAAAMEIDSGLSSPSQASEETPAEIDGEETGDTEEPDILEGAAGNDADWEEWMREELGEGWDDEASERGSRRTSVSPTPSAPDSPRKRVRYADDEDLPLASFRNPPSRQNSGESYNGEEHEDDSPPRKRKVPILLGPPEGGGDAGTNRIELSDKAKAKIAAQAEMAKQNDRADGRLDAKDAAESEIGDGSMEEDGEEEEEDEFAAMLAASMAE